MGGKDTAPCWRQLLSCNSFVHATRFIDRDDRLSRGNHRMSGIYRKTKKTINQVTEFLSSPIESSAQVHIILLVSSGDDEPLWPP